jgi:hypothetical protein
MRSRAARLTIGAVAWIAIGASGFFLYQTEMRIAAERAALRAFDLHAREASDALADVRAGQQAYVAAGQGVAFWMPKVASTLDSARKNIAELQQTARSAEARSALEQAASGAADFGSVDARARDYLKSGQPLMAGDVVFTEGGSTAVNAARQVEAARLAERQWADASDAALRRQEAMALGGAAGLAALVILVLMPRPKTAAEAAPATLSVTGAPAAGSDSELMLRDAAPAAASKAPPAKPTRAPDEVSAATAAGRAVSPVLRAAADICSDFGRVVDVHGLSMLLGRAAEVLDASGVIIWLGQPGSGELRAVLAHGYSTQVLARMPSVRRSDDNAAATAVRTGVMQIVVSRPGASAGAVVAPIVGADGCIGALAAETRHGGESSDSVQALATIFAAQLAGILSASVAQAGASEPSIAEPKAASAN